MKFLEKILLLVFLSGTFYNVDNTPLRLFFMFFWCFVPLFLLFKYNGKKIKKILLTEIFFSFFIFFSLLLSFIVNMDTLSFEFEGPNVEKLTPFLYFFHVSCLFYFYQVKNDGFSENFVSYFMMGIVSVLITDMIVRYLEEPAYFLNYFTRHEAKTIGFFSTTNVNGQIIAFFLVMSRKIKFKHKKIIQISLFVVLITTMARSALVAMLVTILMDFLLNSKGLVSKVISILFVISVIFLFIEDPMGFRSDGSLLSKVEFFESTYNVFKKGNLGDIIFGYGASFKSVTAVLNVQGWSPHVPILKAFLYYGLLGVSIFIGILLNFWINNKKLRMPLIAYIIFGMAGAPIFWPTLSVGMILLKVYDNQKNLLNDNKHYKRRY